MSNDSSNTFCWNVSKVNNSITECLVECELCRNVTCGEREERSVVSIISNQVLARFSEDARPRSNMPVCFLSFLILLQSVQSTEFCQGAAGNLDLMHHIRPFMRYFDHVFEELGFRNCS